MANIKELAEKYESYTIEQRRWFHENAELSNKEYKTTDYIEARLKEMGLEVCRYDGYTGCTAMIYGGKAKPGCRTIALRADIDALPIKENTGLPFSSKNPGVMHACGHDSHTAMLLGAAKVLLEVRDELPGNVKLLFQAAEEVAEGGAQFYIEHGVLDGVDAIYGQHVMPTLPASYLNVQPGPRLSGCGNFVIKVTGHATHGSSPQLGVDAIVAAASIIMNLQTIVSRNCDPRDAVVVTIGKMAAGLKSNIIADSAVMEGTYRTYSREMPAKLETLIRRIAETTAETLGAKAEVSYQSVATPLINDNEQMNRIAHDAAVKLYGEDYLRELPGAMGSEDFAYYTDHVPGLFGFIGSYDEAHSASHHSDGYDIPEDIMKRGVAMHAQIAMDYLSD